MMAPGVQVERPALLSALVISVLGQGRGCLSTGWVVLEVRGRGPVTMQELGGGMAGKGRSPTSPIPGQGLNTSDLDF